MLIEYRESIIHTVLDQSLSHIFERYVSGLIKHLKESFEVSTKISLTKPFRLSLLWQSSFSLVAISV